MSDERHDTDFECLEEAIDAGVPVPQAVAGDIDRVLTEADKYNDLNPDVGVMVLTDWRDALLRHAAQEANPG